jgi:cytochrome c peroxidase
VRTVLLGAAVTAVAIVHAAAQDSDAFRADSFLVRLGERLFFDRSLSADSTISCASCHQPERALTDGKTVAEGIAGRRGTRNTPSLIGVGERKSVQPVTRLFLRMKDPSRQLTGSVA